MESHDRDRRLFDQLYADHRQMLHAYFVGRTADPELALDFLQELFLRVWRSLGSLESLPPERRGYWLYSVARNLVVDYYRARQARDTAQHKLERFATPDHAQSPEANVVEQYQIRALDAAIWRLPEQLRVVLVLAVLGERTSADIGQILGRPPGTIRYQLAQARRRLAADLGLKDPED